MPTIDDDIDYMKLCLSVEYIDKGAADYLVNEAPKLKFFFPSKYLDAVFVWVDGDNNIYDWPNIYKKIYNEGKYNV